MSTTGSQSSSHDDTAFRTLLDGQVAFAERRTESIEQRGQGLLTVLGGLATVVFGLLGFLVGTASVEQLREVRPVTTAALCALVLATCLAGLSLLPWPYSVLSAKKFGRRMQKSTLEDILSRMETDDYANATLSLLQSVQRSNNVKGTLLIASLVSFVAFIVMISLAAYALLS
jgi:hypothetical protein